MLMKNITPSAMHFDTPERGGDRSSIGSNEAAFMGERQGTGDRQTNNKNKSNNGSVVAICEQLEFTDQWEGYKKNLREVHNSSSSINSSCLEQITYSTGDGEKRSYNISGAGNIPLRNDDYGAVVQ